jgi:hypothetical protein
MNDIILFEDEPVVFHLARHKAAHEHFRLSG